MAYQRCHGCMKLKASSPFCEHCGYDERVPNAPHQLPQGTILNGQYLVGKVLGQGGFGITYLGRDIALDTPVAIKEYYPMGMVTRESSTSLSLSVATGKEGTRFVENRERFLREARILAMLQDVPEVVQIRSFFPENNTAYIVMGYVKGITLKEHMRRSGGRLSAAETLRLMKPLMNALGMVHDAGLVHRDISPDNIMLTPQGRVRLIDFGAAHAVTTDGDKSTQAVLKHGFAPPEQYQRRGNLGPWTDIYAICATIYTCITGTTPPTATDRFVGEEDFSWDRIPGLTKQQRAALQQGLELQYARRTQTMEELSNQLYGTGHPKEQPEVSPRGTIALTGDTGVKERQYRTQPRYAAEKAPKKAKKSPMLLIAAAAVLILTAVLGVLLLNRENDLSAAVPYGTGRETTVEAKTGAGEQPEPTDPPETTVPETTVPDPVPEHVVSTATIAATGDLLPHRPIIVSCLQSDGSYDFSPVFQYLKEYSSAADYAVANLETTLYGAGKPYSGYPNFNCPDSIVDGAKEAGFDMLLTGNNHSFDTGFDGYIRTIKVVEEAGLQKLGTMDSPEDEKWTIQEINGIKIGMLSYTYETTTGTRGQYPALNGLPMYGASYEYINCFRMAEPQPFFDEVKGYLAEMEAAGAEATILFIHWGNEYQLKQNSQQTVIAQGLCDLGIDVIIGGHPHVVQPVELLTSNTDPDHKTVCLYSMGNAVSNHRLGNLSTIQTAHTEDGVLFSVTFEKYSDGTVYLAGVDLMPTWVNVQSSNGTSEFNILPLDIDRRDDWKDMFHIDEVTVTAARNSYNRTMAIVGAGMEASQTWLAQAKEAREEYYYNLAWHPERTGTGSAV